MDQLNEIIIASPRYAVALVILCYSVMLLSFLRSRRKSMRHARRNNLNPPAFRTRPHKE